MLHSKSTKKGSKMQELEKKTTLPLKQSRYSSLGLSLLTLKIASGKLLVWVVPNTANANEVSLASKKSKWKNEITKLRQSRQLHDLPVIFSH